MRRLLAGGLIALLGCDDGGGTGIRSDATVPTDAARVDAAPDAAGMDARLPDPDVGRPDPDARLPDPDARLPDPDLGPPDLGPPEPDASPPDGAPPLDAAPPDAASPPGQGNPNVVVAGAAVASPRFRLLLSVGGPAPVARRESPRYRARLGVGVPEIQP